MNKMDKSRNARICLSIAGLKDPNHPNYRRNIKKTIITVKAFQSYIQKTGIINEWK
ncbi:MAG: hypothetical protein R6U04_01695 [Bacteroidales bacterium]